MSPRRTRIKVCCMASPAERDLAVGLGADALGLVGPMPSGPGTIDDETASGIAAGVPPGVTSVLLTSETTADDVSAHVRRVGAAAVQVVSHVDPALYERLDEELPRARARWLQVVHVEDASVLDLIEAYAPHVDAFLLDSGRPSAGVPELGGTGRVHDWSISRAFVERSPLPVFLAGGLHAGNVCRAVEAVRPFGLDLCSGVRTGGALDAGKLTACVAAVAEADARRAAA